MILSKQGIFLVTFLFIILSSFVIIPPHNYLKPDETEIHFITDERSLLRGDTDQNDNPETWNESRNIDPPEPRGICTTKALRGTNYTIIYNAQPKTGSRTLSALSLQLFRKRLKSNTRFQAINITPKDVKMRGNSTKLLEYYRRTSLRTAFIRGHNAFVPPVDRSFICINTIREPIPWMTSSYYFRVNGDPAGRKHTTYNTTDITLDECILRGLPICKPQIKKYFGYFCGDDPICNTPQALERSKANIDKFLVVGLNEEFKDTIRILELLVPDVFKGLTEDYENKFRELKRDFSTISKKKLSKEAENILQQDPNIRIMYEFYEFVKDRFHRLKKCLLND